MSKEDHIGISINEVSQKLPLVKTPVVEKIKELLSSTSGHELAKSEVQKVSIELTRLQVGEPEQKDEEPA